METGDDSDDGLLALVTALATGRRVDVDAFDRLLPPDTMARTAMRVERIRALLAERETTEVVFDTQVDALDGDDDGLLAAEAGEIGLDPQRDRGPRYTLDGLLGQGGAAEVFRARDRRLGRAVALKALRPEIGATRRGRLRFVGESHTTARLAHPGIIPVHDAGRLPDGRLFFTMQQVEGRTLRSVIDGLRADDADDLAQFNLPRLLAAFQRVCLTIDYAHDQGVIHRDLKPENVLIGAYGEVYVADWGLSRPLDDDGDRLTREGETLGTLYYMAPEQACGELEDQGPAIDVWALGVILYELLTLDRPFVGKSVINLVYVIATEPPRPPQPWRDRPLPAPLLALVDDALHKEVEDRTLTPRQMADRIGAWLEGDGAADALGAGGPLDPTEQTIDLADTAEDGVEASAEPGAGRLDPDATLPDVLDRRRLPAAATRRQTVAGPPMPARPSTSPPKFDPPST